eukprot:COSAG02_NODE_502_length_21039_cov_62.499045_8_plen_56_part_00
MGLPLCDIDFLLLFAYSFVMFRISSASSKSFFYCNPALMRFCLLVRFVLVLLYMG